MSADGEQGGVRAGSLVFKYQAPIGQRLHRYFVWVHVDSDCGQMLWFSDKSRQWSPEIGENGASSVAPCRTLRAFRRHLRRHAHALRGRRVTLVSRFIGHDITVQM